MKQVTSFIRFGSRSSRKRGQFRWLPFFLLLLTTMLVFVVAASASSFVLKWGTIGNSDGQFITPRGITVDPSGNVYVTDASGDSYGQVQKFDANGTFLARLGQNNGTAQGFLNAHRITTDSSGNVYATDGAVESAANVVKKFNSSGVFQFAFGTSGGGTFQAAAGIAVDSSDNIYVADIGANVVRKFSSTGTSIGTIGSGGSGDGSFSGPVGIAIDSANNLYVADSGNNRIQKFDSAGTYLTQWGTMGNRERRVQWTSRCCRRHCGNSLCG